MIGGIDRELRATGPRAAFDAILRVCRRRWHDGVFLDADETQSIPLDSPDRIAYPARAEFFVFSDPDTEAAWDDHGPCDRNRNRMLHFLIRAPVAEDATTRVTIVIDEETPDIRTLLAELQAAFDNTGSTPTRNREPDGADSGERPAPGSRLTG